MSEPRRSTRRFILILPGLALGAIGLVTVLGDRGDSLRITAQDARSSVALSSAHGDDVSSHNNSSSIVQDGHTTTVTVTVNEKICRVQVREPVVSVKTVTVNSDAYIEITDRNGTKRRIPCEDEDSTQTRHPS